MIKCSKNGTAALSIFDYYALYISVGICSITEREVKEEVGIDLDTDRGKIVFSNIRGIVDGKKFNDIMDVWLFEYDGEGSLEKATTKEVAQIKWLYPDEIRQLYKNHQFVRTLAYFFEKF